MDDSAEADDDPVIITGRRAIRNHRLTDAEKEATGCSTVNAQRSSTASRTSRTGAS
ncbi:hypothetical protein [Streptomyces caelestis]|uniref:hypothetical protein n=1 Tax=Streptomyces caelestis TaxID=36816 RepID=UPI00366617DB